MQSLPSDVLNIISSLLLSNPQTIEEKFDNVQQIINLCKTNKRFNQILCGNEKLWQELWKRDISTIVPANTRQEYLKALNRLNQKEEGDLLKQAGIYDYEQVLKNEQEKGINIKEYANKHIWNGVFENDSIKVAKYLDSLGENLGETDIHEIASRNPAPKIAQYLIDNKNVKPYSIIYETIRPEGTWDGRAEDRFKLFKYFIDKYGVKNQKKFDELFSSAGYDDQINFMKYLLNFGKPSQETLDKLVRDKAKGWGRSNKELKTLKLVEQLGGDLDQNGGVLKISPLKKNSAVRRYLEDKNKEVEEEEGEGERKLCTGRTASGKPCSRRPKPGCKTCFQH